MRSVTTTFDGEVTKLRGKSLIEELAEAYMEGAELELVSNVVDRVAKVLGANVSDRSSKWLHLWLADVLKEQHKYLGMDC